MHDDWSVRAWSVATGEQLFRRDLLYPQSPAFTPDGHGLFFRGRQRNKDGTAGKELAVVVDIPSGGERPTPAWATDVGRAVYSPGGAWLATAHADGTIRIRASRSGPEILQVR